MTVSATGGIASRLEHLRRSPAWQNYELVRERVLALKEREAARVHGTGAPSDYWAEELSGFEYMLDASPMIVEKLRHHTYHVTGLRVYDYRTHKDGYKAQLERKLEALVEVAGGKELFVPEPRILGGFGFEIAGELVNLDTLKYFETLIAMDLGAILGEFRNATMRKAVWEIGAGWGGLAYQFKTVCPNATYFIVDFPELFLFSAVNLMTLFPDAKVRFFGDVPEGEEMENWEDYDFIFIPHTRLEAMVPPKLDLTINTVSFQEMTTTQVETYVAHAAALGCPYLYSLNRERSLYNPELRGVHAILAEHYWPHEIDVLPVSYVQMLDKVPAIGRAKRMKLKAKYLAQGKLDPTSTNDYRHVIGWRRIIT